MAASRKGRKTEEFGDFQTPASLAREVCKFLAARGIAPASMLEPTCGTGSFLLAALDHFPSLKRALGVEINPDHVNRLTAALRLRSDAAKVQAMQGDFFAFDWPKHLADLPDPILVLGNPPWVTNAPVTIEVAAAPQRPCPGTGMWGSGRADSPVARRGPPRFAAAAAPLRHRGHAAFAVTRRSPESCKHRPSAPPERAAGASPAPGTSRSTGNSTDPPAARATGCACGR